MRRNLSVNLGVRYDLVTTPIESEGRVAGLLRLDDLETGPLGVTPGAPLFDNPSGRSVSAARSARHGPPDRQRSSVAPTACSTNR